VVICDRYSITVNQVIVATVKLSKWSLPWCFRLLIPLLKCYILLFSLVVIFLVLLVFDNWKKSLYFAVSKHIEAICFYCTFVFYFWFLFSYHYAYIFLYLWTWLYVTNFLLFTRFQTVQYTYTYIYVINCNIIPTQCYCNLNNDNSHNTIVYLPDI